MNILTSLFITFIAAFIEFLTILSVYRKFTINSINKTKISFRLNLLNLCVALFPIISILIYFLFVFKKPHNFYSVIAIILFSVIPSLVYILVYKKYKNILISPLGRSFTDAFFNKDILPKILITIGVVILYRALANVPLPGIDMKVYTQYFGKSTVSEINYIFTVFTGGRLETPSLVGLGIAAYINASIIMQILPYAIPRLKEIQKDGERGRQIINQITRYITLPLGIIYSIGYVLLISSRDLSNPNGDPSISSDPNHNPVYLISHVVNSQWPSIQKIFLMVIILTAGTILLMWLSEIITERGIGNGSSIIITIGILSSLPVLLNQDFSKINIGDISKQVLVGNFSALQNPLTLALLAVIVGGILVIAGIIFVNESVRKINIQYARRVRGSEIGKGSFLPIKFTLTGVLPVIFTYAILSLPQLVVPLLQKSALKDSAWAMFLDSVKNGFLFSQTTQSTTIDKNAIIYAIVYFILVIIFGLFYAFIVLNPKEAAENLQKSGAFIPGIRPGKSTENYISGVLLRVSFIGAIFLGIIAEIPLIARDIVLGTSGKSLSILSGIGGTSVLILVGVLLDTYRQYRSLQATRSYEKYINN